MKYNKSDKYNSLIDMIMGPNPLKLDEELLKDTPLKEGSVVCDLGSGNGLTSLFLRNEYGFNVYATDLWGEPVENINNFQKRNISVENITFVKADANSLNYTNSFFDAIIATDSYNYYGCNKNFLEEKILPFIKKDGYLYISVAGMKNVNKEYPKELFLSWTEEQLEYIKTIDYWKEIIQNSKGINIIKIEEMEVGDEAWLDWVKLDNEYAINDRKAIYNGALKYLCFIKIILQKK